MAKRNYDFQILWAQFGTSMFVCLAKFDPICWVPTRGAQCFCYVIHVWELNFMFSFWRGRTILVSNTGAVTLLWIITIPLLIWKISMNVDYVSLVSLTFLFNRGFGCICEKSYTVLVRWWCWALNMSSCNKMHSNVGNLKLDANERECTLILSLAWCNELLFRSVFCSEFADTRREYWVYSAISCINELTNIQLEVS